MADQAESKTDAPIEPPFDESTKKAVQKIPLLSVKAGPRDPNWTDRLKEEYQALIQYVQMNKSADNDWFTVESNATGTR